MEKIEYFVEEIIENQKRISPWISGSLETVYLRRNLTDDDPSVWVDHNSRTVQSCYNANKRGMIILVCVFNG